MRSFCLLSCGVLACCLFGGCMTAPVVPPIGWIYTEYKAPLDVDAQSNPVGPKSGESSMRCILGLVSVGDASLESAIKDGGIKRVDAIDYRYKNIVFGIVQRYTTIVHGE